jgi:hypothetical protein
MVQRALCLCEPIRFKAMIVVGKRDDVALSDSHSGVQRCRLTLFAFKQISKSNGICLPEFSYNRGCVVVGVVVYDDHFPLDIA